MNTFCQINLRTGVVRGMEVRTTALGDKDPCTIGRLNFKRIVPRLKAFRGTHQHYTLQFPTLLVFSPGADQLYTYIRCSEMKLRLVTWRGEGKGGADDGGWREGLLRHREILELNLRTRRGGSITLFKT